MRNLLTACTALLVIMGAVSVNLWRELRSERQRVVDLHDQLAQARAAATVPKPLPVPKPVVEAPTAPPVAEQTPAPLPAPPVAQSAETATARVAAWSTRFAGTPQALTPEQLQALNAAAIAELARETEESLAIDSRAAPMDALARARLNQETVTRQHDTNLRILERMASQLTAEQSSILRTMIEAWARPRLAAARAELERVATSRD